MTETRNTDTGPMCPGQVLQNIRYSVPPTCVDNWCYYRKATDVRIKPGMISACSHVNIFSSEGSAYKITSTLTLFVTHISISTNTSRLIPTIACWTLRFVILPFFHLMITALSGTQVSYSTHARHLTLNLVQWTQHNTNTKACRWKWPWAILTNLPWS